MSVIAARKGNGRIEVACDSQTTRGDWMKEMRDTGKIVQVNKRFAVGAVGYSEAGAMFRRYAKSHRPERNDEDAIADYMLDFYEWGDGKTSDVKRLNEESEYMLVLEDEIWTVHGFLVSRKREYAAIGSGMGEALAAMMLGKSAKEAVWVACQINLYCHEPVVTFSVKPKDAKV